MEFFPDNTTFLVLGPLVLRWYALAYIGGLVIGWRWLRVLAQKAPAVATPLQADEFLTWATVGVVLGGRLGYVLFYQPVRYLSDPMEIFAVWHGGMSFHGGMLGVAIAVVAYCRRPSGLGWGGWRISPMASCGGARRRPACLGRCAFPAPATCCGIRASCTRLSWKGFCCWW